MPFLDSNAVGDTAADHAADREDRCNQYDAVENLSLHLEPRKVTVAWTVWLVRLVDTSLLDTTKTTKAPHPMP